MSVVQPVGTGASSKFAPSLNLNEIRSVVGRLGEHHLDVLAYIQDDDGELCKITKTDKAHLESYLGKLYLRLGINTELPSAEKRRAAALMNSIYDKNGWRPDEDDEAFLLMARGAVTGSSAAAPRIDSEKVIVPLTQRPAPSTCEVDDPQVQQEHLPPTEAVASNIRNLSEWKFQFLGWVMSGLTKEQMLDKLQLKDVSADLSTIESGLKKLYKALGIRHAYEDESARALIFEAYAQYTKQAPQKPEEEECLVQKKEPENPSNRAVDSGNVSNPSGPIPSDLGPIVARMSQMVREGNVTEHRIRALDALIGGGTRSEIAASLGISEGNLSVYICNIRRQFQISSDSAEKGKRRAAQELAVLLSAWRLYREHGSLTVDDEQHLDANVAPTEVREFAPEPVVVDAVTEQEAEQPAPEPEILLELEPVSEPVPQREPVAVEPETPRPQEPEPQTSVVTTDMSAGLLHNPQSVCSVKTIWSNSPTFAEDQVDAVASGYVIERIDHYVSFHPIFQSASVLVLVLRSSP